MLANARQVDHSSPLPLTAFFLLLSFSVVAIRYCIFNQPTIVQIVIPNADILCSYSISCRSRYIYNKLLFIVQCNFVVKTVRTLNKLRSLKVVLSGYFFMLKAESTRGNICTCIALGLQTVTSAKNLKIERYLTWVDRFVINVDNRNINSCI